MKKINLVKCAILLIVITASCGFKRNSFENYRETINETLNPQSTNLKEIQNIYDVKDMRGCGMKIELGVWSKNKRLSSDDEEIWSRSSSAYGRGITGSGNQYIDFRKEDFTPYLINNPNKHYIVYIGPWQYAKKVGKEIRFMAFQDIDYKNPSRLNYHGTIRFQFESKNSENQKIPSKPYNLLSDGNPSKEDICIVKWIANHGYNAVSKVKSKNPFSSNYMVPTGEIIEVEE